MKSIWIVLIALSLGVFLGVMFEYFSPSNSYQFQRRARSECMKCGSSSIKLRYCTDRCETPCPTLDKAKRGSPVVWGHEHLHRTCGSCGFAGDAMECLDKEQP